MHFYELHEGDGDTFGDLMLVRDEEMDPEDFFELVQSIRGRVQGSFQQDTLIEAIAAELERNHGFTFVSDDRLTAAVNVSRKDGDNFLADLDADDDDREDEEEGREDDDVGDDDFRTILAEFDPRGDVQPN
ncbi:MAG: hypothetical protein AABZ33_02255 [Chloroflexota bacterium]